MQQGRLVPQGLASLNLHPRSIYAPRLLQLRTIRVFVSAHELPKDLAEQEQEGRRTPGSRRTLFTDAAPSAAPPDTATSARELLDIHNKSLQDAGVSLSPLELQKNRLHSVRNSLVKEARGSARAAVNREFELAERRLYSLQRRLTRGGGADPEEEAALMRQLLPQAAEEAEAAERAKAKGKSVRRERNLDQINKARAARAAAKAVARHELLKRQGAASTARAAGRGLGAGAIGKGAPAGARARAAQRAVKVEEADDDDEDGDESDEDDEGEDLAETFSLADTVQDMKDRMPQSGSRGGAQQQQQRGGGGSDDRNASAPRPVTDLADPGENLTSLHFPRLSHNLPPDLNLRLLEVVLAGDKISAIPEVSLGSAGITNGIISSMLSVWRNNEIVKIRVRRKRRTDKKYLPYISQVCKVLESRSGGVVIWRSGRSMWLYRGANFQTPGPTKAREEVLGKVDVPLCSPGLSATAPLKGQTVQMGQGTPGYLTRGSANLYDRDPAGVPSAPAGVGIIFLHDAFGPGSPDGQEHCKHVCDLLSSVVGPGTPVLMPDLTRGGKGRWEGPLWPPKQPAFERQSGWLGREGMGHPAAVVQFVQEAVSYMRSPEVGATRLVLAGSGWGGWLATHYLAADATRMLIQTQAAAAPAAATAATKAAAAGAAPAVIKALGKKAAKVPPGEVIAAASRKLWEAMQAALSSDAGPLAQGLWLLGATGAPEVKAYRQTNASARYGMRRPRQMPPDVYKDGKGLLFSAGLVGSAMHMFEDEERTALAISVPLCIVSSKRDPMEKFQLFMMPPLVDKCAFKRFGRVKPGFWGRMAEWSDPVQCTQATQATQLAGWFLRWHMAGDGVAQERVRKFCMIGKCGVGEKQIYNQGFPWLEQVLLYRGWERNKQRGEAARREDLVLPPQVTAKERAKEAREARKKEQKAREMQREQRPGREGDAAADGARGGGPKGREAREAGERRPASERRREYDGGVVALPRRRSRKDPWPSLLGQDGKGDGEQGEQEHDNRDRGYGSRDRNNRERKYGNRDREYGERRGDGAAGSGHWMQRGGGGRGAGGGRNRRRDDE